jgi:hypothetical protein
MVTVVLVGNHERKRALTAVLDFEQVRLSPSLVIYNGLIDFQLASVLSKMSDA